jgi:predicted DNA-binding transcriptional regulator YafY
MPPETERPTRPAPHADAIGGRVTRLMQIVNLVQQGQARTPDHLAEKLDVSRRTVFRDIRTLQRAGVPIVSREGGRGYAIEASHPDAPAGPTAVQSMGLMLLSRFARSLPDQPLLRPGIDAIESLTARLPQQVRQVYEELMRPVTVKPGEVAVRPVDAGQYRTLQMAIEGRKICRLVYEELSPHDRLETVIHPLHLHFWRRAWYLIAFCESRGADRTFRLSHIQSLEATERSFPLRRFSLREYLDDAWGMTPEGRKYDIVIDFSPGVAQTVADVNWHQTQQAEFHDDGSCTMRFRVNGLGEIKWWILSFGDQAAVRRPPELRAEVRRIALTAAEQHGDS